MPSAIRTTALVVFCLCFLIVTAAGFLAARWRRADLQSLEEWGLAGRRFGTLIVWFLIGGDFYTAYTVIAVPAALYGAGAIGFFAVPYCILSYPLMMLVLPKLWTICHRERYITLSDYVRGRYRSRWLSVAFARHRHSGDYALHRAAAGRHPRGDRGNGDSRRVAADPGLRDPRRLHLYQRPARSRRDRHRQGCDAVHHGARRGHHHPGKARRLRRCLRERRACAVAAHAAGLHSAAARAVLELLDPRHRICAGAALLSAHFHRHAQRFQRECHPAQRRAHARIQHSARA